MGTGNGFCCMNPSRVMNGHTCKVGLGRRGKVVDGRAPALDCAASLSTFSMRGCKCDIFVSLGLSIGVQRDWGGRGSGCKFREIN